MTESNAFESLLLILPKRSGHTMPHRATGKTPDFGKEAESRSWGKL